MNCQELAAHVDSTQDLPDFNDRIAELNSLLVGKCFKFVHKELAVVIKVLRVAVSAAGDDIDIVSSAATLRHDWLGSVAIIEPKGVDSTGSMSDFLRDSVEIDDSEFKRIRAVVKFCDNRIKKDLEALQ